jgi:hypothetical protein
MPGIWSPLAHQPTFGAGTMFLLTDGTVMCQNSGTSHWWKLTPDINGNYVNGTWSALADGPNVNKHPRVTPALPGGSIA